MTYYLTSKEVKGMVGSLEVTNDFYTCGKCKEEDNFLHWFITMKRGSDIVYECPHCNTKNIKEKK